MVFRSIVFNAVFYLNLAAFLLLGSWLLITPRAWSMAALKALSRVLQWWLEAIAGTRMEVRGAEHLPTGAALVAGKHQSMWETFALFQLFDDPTMVMKRELMWLPFLGWFAHKFGMIPVDRAARGTALKSLLRRAEAAIADNRQIIVFPEGTRRAPDARPDYKS
ncbi:MAG TPA: lysophospholipid acyltransferase family protein, partial [Aestuariivirgaceae bacterium]|nr:lysophospholipid acyltransferase family protein [Aestuariivirgaceae bacterium]